MLNESLPHDEFPFSLESLLLYNYYIRNRGLEIMPIFTADVVEIRENRGKKYDQLCAILDSLLVSAFLLC